MLFDPKKGIGLSMLRQPMGASDFALERYTYDDLPPGQIDPDMKLFSIDHDRTYVIPSFANPLRSTLALRSSALPEPAELDENLGSTSRARFCQRVCSTGQIFCQVRSGL